MAVLKFGNGNVGKISVIEPYDDNIGRVDFSPEISTGDWVRPSDWLDMPTVSEGVAVLLYVPSGAKDFGVGLFARNGIYTNCPTYIPIDWGDGHSGIFQGTRTDNINYAGNFGTQYKKYDFDLLPESSQIEVDGFPCRQVIVQLDGSISGITHINLEGMSGRNFGDTYDYNDTDYYTDEYGNKVYDARRNDDSRKQQTSYILDVIISGANIDEVYLQSTDINRGNNTNCQRAILNVKSFNPYSTFRHNMNLEYLEFPSGATAGYSDFYYMFENCNKIKNLPFFDTSSATGVYAIFANCHSIESVPQYDFSNVTNFQSAFHRCLSLKNIPELDFSNGENFYSTFSYNHQLASIPSGVDFGTPTGCRDMFFYCYNLRRAPIIDLSDATDIRNMFYFCNSLGGSVAIDGPNIRYLTTCFYACPNLEKIHIKSIGPVTDFTQFIRSCSQLKEIVWDNSKQETSSGINFNEAFAYNYSMTSYPEMDTSSATGCRYMFNSNYLVKEYQTFDFSNCTYSEGMFINNYALTDVSFKNVQNKPNTNSMFSQCWNLRTAPSGFFEGYDSTPWYCPGMFSSCHVLTDASHYIISGITNTSTNNQNLFIDCHRLNKPPSVINTEYGLRGMFYKCYDLQNVSYDSIRGDCLQIFRDCRSLSNVNIASISGNFNVGFYNCLLGSGEITKIINSLEGVGSNIIDFRYNYGTSYLHPDTLAIATSKGWTVLT
jgi:hypothetical protein